MRILLVEDDVKIASFVEKGLRAAGYAVDHAIDAERGVIASPQTLLNSQDSVHHRVY